MEKSLYFAHINEVDSISRPILIVGRNTQNNNDYEIVLIHRNNYFHHINKYSITVDRLFTNLDFQQYTRKLLESKTDSDNNELVYIGSNNRKVELYGFSRRTTQAGNLSVDKSDIAIIQVNVAEMLSELSANNRQEKLKIINDFNSKELSSINETLDKINIAIIHQEYINKDFIKTSNTINEHSLLQITKKLSISKLISVSGLFFSLFTMLISILNTGNPILVENAKETMEHIKEIIK